MTTCSPLNSLTISASQLLAEAMSAVGLDEATRAQALADLRADPLFGLSLFCPTEEAFNADFDARVADYATRYWLSFQPAAHALDPSHRIDRRKLDYLLKLTLPEIRDLAKARAALYEFLGSGLVGGEAPPNLLKARYYTALTEALNPALAVELASKEYGKPIPGGSLHAKFLRVIDPGFWSRMYKREARRAQEFLYIRSGLVAKHKERYVSDSTLQLFRDYRKSQADYLGKHYVVDRRLNNKGKHSIRLLSDVVKSDEAKKAKLWAFLSGIEELSVEAGLSCSLLTLTLPSSYHAAPAFGGGQFDGVSTPRDGGQVLSQLWNNIQRDLDNRGIALSGCRFVEVHGDATPHWHVWLHYQPRHFDTLLAVVSRYFPGDPARGVAPVRVRTVEEDLAGKLISKKDGKRFSEHYQRYDPVAHGLVDCSSRVPAQADFSVINRDYANGATYAAKYALKSFEPGDASERVNASRWVWGIRGFQLFGIQRCLTAWDELFRAKVVPEDPAVRALFNCVHEKPGRRLTHVRNRDTGKVEELEVEGGTAAFIKLQGGLAAARGHATDTLRIKLFYVDAIDRYTDPTRVKVGLYIVRGDDWLYDALTREPGRFMLLPAAGIEDSLEHLVPLLPDD